MGLFNDPSLSDIFGVTAIVIFIFLSYIKWHITYWDRRNIPYIEPSLVLGTMENPFKRTKSIGLWLKLSYDILKAQGYKHGGIYNIIYPVYLAIHPEYVKNVMQNDFQYFSDRGIFYNEEGDHLTVNLIALNGQKWEKLRAKVMPAFTTEKIKLMFDVLVECSLPMVEFINKYTQNKQEIDIKEVASRFTTDVIGSVAFGLDCGSFESDYSEFRKYSKRIFEKTTLQHIIELLLLTQPKLGKLLRMRKLPKEVTDFFMKVIKDTVNYRNANNIVRMDMLQILIDLKNSTDDVKGDVALTLEEIAAQAFQFFIAGFETSSIVMTYCLYELACNEEIQQRVRDEINYVTARHHGKVTYDTISDMEYMTKVLEETLRKYPPIPQLVRKCVKDYQVPGTDVVVEKGMTAFISVLGLHYDPEFYSNPEMFDPERFSNENKNLRNPFCYIPFGEGPRACIGARFGLTLAKVGLATLLKDFHFSVSKKTELPLEVDSKKFVFSTTGIIWLDSRKVE